MSKITTIPEIMELSRETLVLLGYVEVYNCLDVRWAWAMPRETYATARYNPIKDVGCMCFSRFWWGKVSDRLRRENVIHELCHVVNHYLWHNVYLGRRPPRRQIPPLHELGYDPGHHGMAWGRLMMRAGVNPRVSYPPDYR